MVVKSQESRATGNWDTPRVVIQSCPDSAPALMSIARCIWREYAAKRSSSAAVETGARVRPPQRRPKGPTPSEDRAFGAKLRTKQHASP